MRGEDQLGTSHFSELVTIFSYSRKIVRNEKNFEIRSNEKKKGGKVGEC